MLPITPIRPLPDIKFQSLKDLVLSHDPLVNSVVDDPKS
jgi:hypothetical protein